MLQILFVCSANIVRSPAFEGFMRYLLAKKGMEDRVHVDSCGVLTSTEGSLPSTIMQLMAEEEGVTIDHIAKPFVDAYFDQFDAIFAVDRSVFNALFARAYSQEHRDKLYLTAQFSKRQEEQVGDPYSGHIGYQEVWDLIKKHSKAILTHYIKEKLANSH